MYEGVLYVHVISTMISTHVRHCCFIGLSERPLGVTIKMNVYKALMYLNNIFALNENSQNRKCLSLVQANLKRRNMVSTAYITKGVLG